MNQISLIKITDSHGKQRHVQDYSIPNCQHPSKLPDRYYEPQQNRNSKLERHIPSLPLALECITFGSQVHTGHFSEQIQIPIPIRVKPICAVPHKNLSSTAPHKKPTQKFNVPPTNAASLNTFVGHKAAPEKHELTQ